MNASALRCSALLIAQGRGPADLQPPASEGFVQEPRAQGQGSPSSVQELAAKWTRYGVFDSTDEGGPAEVDAAEEEEEEVRGRADAAGAAGAGPSSRAAAASSSAALRARGRGGSAPAGRQRAGAAAGPGKGGDAEGSGGGTYRDDLDPIDEQSTMEAKASPASRLAGSPPQPSPAATRPPATSDLDSARGTPKQAAVAAAGGAAAGEEQELLTPLGRVLSRQQVPALNLGGGGGRPSGAGPQAQSPPGGQAGGRRVSPLRQASAGAAAANGAGYAAIADNLERERQAAKALRAIAAAKSPAATAEAPFVKQGSYLRAAEAAAERQRRAEEERAAAEAAAAEACAVLLLSPVGPRNRPKAWLVCHRLTWLSVD